MPSGPPAGRPYGVTRLRFPTRAFGNPSAAMGTGRYPEGAHDEDAHPSTEETTLAEGEWPVAEPYRVEPRETPVEDATIVLQQEVPPEREPPRRFPPEVGRGVALGLLAALLALILIPAGIWLATRSGDESSTAADTNTVETTTQPTTTTQPPTTSPEQAVPDVTGQPLAQARELLEDQNLRSRFRRVASDRPRNEVLSQTPRPGTETEPGVIVVLTASGGPGAIAVPDAEGDEPSPPPPSEPATIRVPSLVGMKSADARSRLQSVGLRSTQRPVESSRPAGTVVSQSPGAGAELREGGTVTLRVSTGPARVEVPDVVGLNEAAAIQELEAAGFAVRVVDEPTLLPTEDGIVLDQNPRAGSSRREGSTVTITVARFA